MTAHGQVGRAADSMAATMTIPIAALPAAVPVSARRYLGPGRYAKRLLDLLVAMVGIVVLCPLWMVLAIAIGLSSAGSPLFGQRRVGNDGCTFRCWKLRTMYSDAEERLHADPELFRRYVANDYKLEVDDDPRITPLGRWLRRLSLDEIPQLLNVIAGDMSLVGPRPVVADELASYGPWKDAYLAARPGITGPWQCSGRNDIRYPERAQIDAEYIEQWSFWGDVKLIFRTVPAVLRRNGVG